MNLTPSEWGVVMIVISVVLYWPLGKLPKIRALLVLAGLILAGATNGRLISLAAHITGLLGHVFNTLTTIAFGAAIPGLAVLVAGILLLHDLMPKHAAKGRTYWLAWAVGIAIAAGATGIAGLNQVPGAAQTAISSAATTGPGG